MPRSTRMVVYFPDPFGPRKPCTSPPRTSRSSPSSATVRPKYFFRPRTSIGDVMVPSSRWTRTTHQPGWSNRIGRTCRLARLDSLVPPYRLTRIGPAENRTMLRISYTGRSGSGRAAAERLPSRHLPAPTSRLTQPPPGPFLAVRAGRTSTAIVSRHEFTCVDLSRWFRTGVASGRRWP